MTQRGFKKCTQYALAGVLLVVAGAVPLATVTAAPVTSVAAEVAAEVTAEQGRSAESQRPNFVMVMADDMRVDDLMFAPNIRKHLGRRGITYDNSFSPFPLCCPARTSFLTGQHAHNHRVWWHKAPFGYRSFDDSRTLATSLTAAGYNTGFIGKYLNGYGPMKSRVSGKRSYKYVPKGWTDWRAAIENPGVKGIKGSTYNYFRTPYNVNGRIDRSRLGEYQTNTLGDFAVDMAGRFSKKSKPFFIYLSSLAPHHGGPREPGDPSVVRHSDGTHDGYTSPARPDWVKGKFNRIVSRPSGLPRNGDPSERDVSDKPGHISDRAEFTRAQRKALTNVTRQRAESIYVLDRQVGRLVRKLKRTGEWNNTVMMFTSDNGYFLGEHRRPTGKVLGHEPSLRVPFLITGPGMRAGEKRNDPITNIDVTATILDLAGATPPHTADGRSHRTTLRDGDAGWTQPVFFEAVHSTRGRKTEPLLKNDRRSSFGVRTPRYSFTIYKTGERELYDLYADPAQMQSLHDDPRFVGLTKELTDLVIAYRNCRGSACHAPMPTHLQATTSQNTALTQNYWSTIHGIYGRTGRAPRR